MKLTQDEHKILGAIEFHELTKQRAKERGLRDDSYLSLERISRLSGLNRHPETIRRLLVGLETKGEITILRSTSHKTNGRGGKQPSLVIKINPKKDLTEV